MSEHAAFRTMATAAMLVMCGWALSACSTTGMADGGGRTSAGVPAGMADEAADGDAGQGQALIEEPSKRAEGSGLPILGAAGARPLPHPVEPDDAWLAAVAGGTRTFDGRPGEDYWTNEASYRIAAELDPASRTVTGTAWIDYVNHSPDRLPVLLLELAQNLHKPGTVKHEPVETTAGIVISGVKVDGRWLGPVTLEERFTQNRNGYVEDGTRLIVFPDSISMIAPGDTVRLEIGWSFEVPQQGGSGRMGWSRDNLFYIGYWYPQMAVYDDVVGWMADSFTGMAEFYHGFADYELEITAPEGWVVMGTGELLNPQETLAPDVYARYEAAALSDEPIRILGPESFGKGTLTGGRSGKLTWRFSSKQVRDVAFSATRESIWDGTRAAVGDLDGDGETDHARIHTFWRESAPLWSEQVRYAKHSIEFLSSSLAWPYPWPHMTSVEGEDIIGGGMEFPMMTVIGPYTRRSPEALYSVTAHELAHMWFPMIVSTNERRYSWMDEGTTDFNTHFAESDYFPGVYDNDNVFGSYLQIAGSDIEGEMMRWSDFHTTPTAFGIASYSKPAAVLMALRSVLGAEVFDEAFHEYLRRWAWRHPYPWDLWNTFEDVSGRDLDWFWSSWYQETWVLDHALEAVQNIGGQVLISVRDNGNVVMPMVLEIEFEDGSMAERRIEETFWLSGERATTLRIASASPAVAVRIDPGLTVPDADRSNNDWFRDGE